VLNARLTRFYERIDWKRRLTTAQSAQPLLLERGLSMSFNSPLHSVPDSAPASEPKPTLDRAAAAVMARIAEDAAQQAGGKVQFASLDAMRSKSATAPVTTEVTP
jgi:hypothetical protein